jgi:hypothetical protein|tara:strand:- start:587 stop:763 length:177 start_codon:yes stop_codon:yes gene_type:complete
MTYDRLARSSYARHVTHLYSTDTQTTACGVAKGRMLTSYRYEGDERFLCKKCQKKAGK